MGGLLGLDYTAAEIVARASGHSLYERPPGAPEHYTGDLLADIQLIERAALQQLRQSEHGS